MRILECDQIVMRMYIGESDKHHGRPLYHKILDLLKEENAAGATVFRGIAGFGMKSEISSNSLLAISKDLPIVIEIVDSEEKINSIRPQVEEYIENGLITVQKVHVAKFETCRT